MRTVKIGSRESRLAVIQSRMVADYINACPGLSAEIITMKTTGDIILDRPLDEVGGKGLFVKELDRALASAETELSVHSLKDMPMNTPENLPVLGYSPREDARDVLVLPKGCEKWDMSKPVGCSGRRRSVQLRRLYPEVRVAGIRGNVITRLEKLDSGEYGALVLAAAGLKRLGLIGRISRYFSTEEIIPAAGQGILAVQGRTGVDYGYLNGYFDPDAALCAAAERAFVKKLDGGCSLPIAAYAEKSGETLTLTGLYCDESQNIYRVGRLTAPCGEAEELGMRLAERLLGGNDGR